VDSGGPLRDYQLARQLARNAEVTYAAICYPDFEGQGPEGQTSSAASTQMGDGLDAPETVFHRYVTFPDARRYAFANVLKGALGPTPVTLLNWTSSKAAERLARLGLETKGGEKTFDTIQVEGVHLLNYLPVLRQFAGTPPIVCDWHDILSVQMARYADTEASLLKRTYARRTASLLKRAEKQMLHACDAHVAVSEQDRDALLANSGPSGLASGSIEVIENGVDTAYFSDVHLEAAYARWQQASSRDYSWMEGSAPLGDGTGSRRRLLFVGAMDYHGNIEAVTRFAREAWPRIRQECPELRLTIVGRKPTPAVASLQTASSGIEVTGTVPDVRPYYREAFAAVVPLRMGSGTRLKILEAMAAGVPVVSTPLGAEGLDVMPQSNILIADTDRELADAVLALKREPSRGAALAAAARELVMKRYDWSAIGQRLLAVHERLRTANGKGATLEGRVEMK
jgi:polysaccharide biosynthesis protein PslH